MKNLDIIKTPKKEVIKTAVQVLEAGGLIIFPTETTYGAGVDATNQEAVNKLLVYKTRREGKPLSIAVQDQKSAAKYVEINQQAKKLYQRFLPGPVTIISKSLGKVALGVESEFSTLGVRIPDHKLMLKILKAFGKPITATSANASGKKRPYSIDDIMSNLSQKQKNLIDLVLDAGQLAKNDPSTVIDTTFSTPTTLRAGKIKTIGRESLVSRCESETKKIAGTLMLKHWNKIKKSGLVIGLDGPLGAGKTVFTKGVGKFLQIKEIITSPTYSYIEEYDYQRHGVSGKLYHIDLWKIETAEELKKLEIEELIAPNNVVVIEWWEQGKTELDKKTNLKILISEKENKTREIKIIKIYK
ncbi:threonylcarbamoyl-AMP synthase [Patescibacteria group bacterium]|nr:threonylcarbamoyl-AMP synthase [Patescibacteria group bacterium]MBU1885890.1 threonylcarbamoyl-AMP synthase [Patescibacteria group bacterium]